MTVKGNSLIGVGLYTTTEAGRLTGIHPTTIRRWLYGHTRTKNGQIIKDEPLWYSQIDIADEKNLSFRDLMEVRALNEFKMAGLSLQLLRKATIIAQKLLNDKYPFSSKKLKTDGEKLYIQLKKDSEIDEKIKTIEIFSKQQNFTRIIKQSLKDIDFEDTHPICWWIDGRDKDILVNPHRSFGQPIDDKSGVPTAILYEAVGANKNHDEEADEIVFKEVARDFNVAFENVKRSYDFECRLAT